MKALKLWSVKWSLRQSILAATTCLAPSEVHYMSCYRKSSNKPPWGLFFRPALRPRRKAIPVAEYFRRPVEFLPDTSAGGSNCKTAVAKRRDAIWVICTKISSYDHLWCYFERGRLLENRKSDSVTSTSNLRQVECNSNCPNRSIRYRVMATCDVILRRGVY